MASDWEYIKLKDVLELVADNRGRNPESYSEQGIPVIDNYLIVSESYINLKSVKRFIDGNTYENFIRKHIQKNDVLITLVGNGYGQVALTPSKKCVIIQNTVGLRCNINNDNKFLYYLLKNNRKALMNLNIGAAQPSIKVGNLTDLEFEFPPLTEQKAIAHILGSLDDKIELNRQMNETLEAMAQALFKSWFVDFDPVIDNALKAGNPIPDEWLERGEQRQAMPSSDTDNQAIRALFPNAFEFTEEMGWIPEGWAKVQIKDIARVIKGKSYKSSELLESKTALVTLKSFKRGGGYRLDGLKEYTGKYKEEQEVKAGDLVIAYTDVTQAADLIGKPAMVIDDARYEHLVISLDVAVVRPEIDNQKYYLYGLAQTDAFQSHNYSHSTGTTVLHLSKNAVPDYHLCMPSDNLLNTFTNVVKPLFTSVNNNIGGIRNLEKLRDTLLPKLLSGELRIADAAAMVEDV
ncbi:restriction endonuclease subunit S [Psychrobacter frigidicola]|uniref:restriction endonuclease subunit S n=1 Tax=Psychrobacter frigidicola TaxID=45611 RepID=UPI00191A8EC3|nr:restriction endonuclease subunit S [Psychrobacter frigidicola]